MSRNTPEPRPVDIPKLMETHKVYPFTLARVVRNTVGWGLAMAVLYALAVLVKGHGWDWYKLNWIVATTFGPAGPIFNLGMYFFRNLYARKITEPPTRR